jgi:hypothetical protein
MAGVPSAWLVGWATPAQFNPNVDHTYVVSSCGLRWGCWGRDQGGMPIRGAAGSSQLADCLSQPNSQAGILYAITGVCHQTANRSCIRLARRLQGVTDIQFQCSRGANTASGFGRNC